MTPSVHDALALARAIGLQGFVPDQRPERPAAATPNEKPESNFLLAKRLNLPGFADESPLPAAATPSASPARTISRPIVGTLMQSVAAHSTTQRSQHKFLCVDIACGGEKSFAELEAKMRQSFASTIGGRATWLQRTNADGSQTRAYPVYAAGKFEGLTGELGGPSLRLGIRCIRLPQFAVRSKDGAMPAQTSVGFVDDTVASALKKALGR